MEIIYRFILHMTLRCRTKRIKFVKNLICQAIQLEMRIRWRKSKYKQLKFTLIHEIILLSFFNAILPFFTEILVSVNKYNYTSNIRSSRQPKTIDTKAKQKKRPKKSFTTPRTSYWKLSNLCIMACVVLKYMYHHVHNHVQQRQGTRKPQYAPKKQNKEREEKKTFQMKEDVCLY